MSGIAPRRLPASVSLDLDNQWSYMKTHGDEGWASYPSYFNVFIPHVLDVLDRLQIKITVFVVGKDAAMEKNREWLAMLTERGHEVGNHSFHHEPWIHQFSDERIESEVRDTQNAVHEATGQKPIGYRGPGFSWNAKLLRTLESSGYLYDASTLPTYIGPLARTYYFWTSKLTAEEREQRKGLFGTFGDGRRPVKPYFWDLEGGKRILEIPVTTMPVAKTPFHLSYLLYLSRYSTLLMRLYLKTALKLCALTRTEPSFLLHPLDLIGGEQVPELAFFPGMNLGAEWKVEIFERVLGELRRNYEVMNMSEHARTLVDCDAGGRVRRLSA